ncbi:hypothetical protein SAMN05192583_2487 [Sphingomonas gellani]|uniref:Uncharacterized protein n=1 Tax=Sphingomonas gellani TaxID=1166340 RepID=A0A1H8FLA9_9SPHN|nr:hypothetical protein [Sphingomonas gellani]SEN32591.1 hypothetical protein SAMN05192583_2487 [Sphingomonas gellani]
MKSLLMFAGLGLIAATPALAIREPKPEPAPVASESQAAPAKPTRYCVMTEATGSRIRHKTCMTRAEWLNEGFDPLKK